MPPDGHAHTVVIPGANLSLSPGDVRRAAPAIQRADVLICQLETMLEAFQVAKKARVPTIVNPAPAALLPDELPRLSGVCVPNETEAETLTGQTVTGEEEAMAAARALRNHGPAAVVLTLGERVALLLEDQATGLVSSTESAATPFLRRTASRIGRPSSSYISVSPTPRTPISPGSKSSPADSAVCFHAFRTYATRYAANVCADWVARALKAGGGGCCGYRGRLTGSGQEPLSVPRPRGATG